MEKTITKILVCLWFDMEDYVTREADDPPKKIVDILSRNGVRAKPDSMYNPVGWGLNDDQWGHTFALIQSIKMPKNSRKKTDGTV